MVSALDSGLSDLGSSLSRGTTLCSWARHFITLTVPLEVTLRRTSNPSRGEYKDSLSLHAKENGINSGLMLPLGTNEDFTLPYPSGK